MASFEGVSAATGSLERYLGLCFKQASPITGDPVIATTPAEERVRAVRIRTEDLESTNITTAIVRPALSIYLHRIDFNKTMRAAWSAVGHQEGRAHLPVDLHLLLTPWADNVEAEQRILGRTLQCLEEQPILSGPMLAQSGGWAPHEAVQLCLADLSNEDVLRTFDTLPVDYRISLHYVARVVRIDSREHRPEATVEHVHSDPVPTLEPS